MSETTAESPPARVSRLRRELEAERALLRVLFDESPDGIAIMRPDGLPLLNPAAERVLQTGQVGGEEDPDDWKSTWGFSRLDGTPLQIHELAGIRAMGGEHVVDEEIRVRNPIANTEIIASMTAAPLPGGGSITIMRDVSARVRMEREHASRAHELAAHDLENRKLVDRLRAAIDEIATPILRIADGVLVVPLVGVVDATRSARTTERVLSEVARARARNVIIEVTGAELGDTATADGFVRVTRAVRLLGGRCVVSGMRPAVARTLVEMGVRLDRLPTYPSLKLALRACLAEERAQRDAAEGGRRASEPTRSDSTRSER